MKTLLKSTLVFLINIIEISDKSELREIRYLDREVGISVGAKIDL